MVHAHDCAPARRLTFTEATGIARRGRKLLRRGELTHRELCLLDCLLWSCRKPSNGAIVVSFTALQRLAHQARETVARGLRALERVGLLSRIKRRARIAWHQGGVRVRQMANAYHLHAPSSADHCEFGGATVNQTRTIDIPVSGENSGDAEAARASIVAVAARRAAALGAEWVKKRLRR